MAPKRELFVTTGDGAAPPQGKRVRAETAPGSSSSSRSSELPSSPKHFLAIVLVVLFLKRPKGRSQGTIPTSASQFGRLMLDQICRLINPMYRKLEKVESKLERIEERIEDLTVKVDNIKRPSPNRKNHEQFNQEANKEGTSAEAEDLATALGKGETENTSIRLRFLNGMKTPMYHDDEIKSESNTAIKIGIFDGDKMIESGGLSNVQVEIFALEGDFPHASPKHWTAKKFNKHRAHARDGNGNVLAGEGTKVQLKNGQCDLGSIKFTEGSSKARGGKFIIGARVCEGEVAGLHVQEAVMNPVAVQDRRNKANEKSHPPTLKDSVHRLEEISKDGKYYKRLEKEKIITVEHFLKALNKDPYNLAEILKVNMEHKPWKKMTKHAKECSLEGRHKLKSFICLEKNVKLFFNCVHYLVGAQFFGGQYTLSDKFTPIQQELVDQLKEGAYAELEALPEDHVITNNSPNPIHMDKYTGIGAGPSYTSSEQPNCSIRLAPVQAEGLGHAWTEPSCADVNNDYVPNCSITDHISIQSYQVGGISVPPFEGLSDAEDDLSCVNANNSDPGLNSTSDHLRTYKYQDQGNQLAGQEQFSGSLNVPHQDLVGGLSNMYPLLSHEDVVFLQHQADINNYDAVEIQREIFWSDNDTLEGTPRSVQGSPKSQMQARLAPSNEASEASPLAQQTLAPQHWCPGNGAF